ncbi:MAG: hypothetical protein ACI4S1_07030 [Roseburia sp.]
MIKSKYFFHISGLILVLALAGCGKPTEDPSTTEVEIASNDTSEVLPETTPDNNTENDSDTTTKTETDEASEKTESDEVSEKIETDEVSENSAEDSERFTGELSLAQSIGPDGCAVFEVQNLIYITPEDTDLIEKYGFAPDLDGYDYEVVYSEDGPQMLTAFEDCDIQIIDWDNGKTEYESISLEDFCEDLMNSNGPLQVIYEKDDLDSLTFIMVDYAG